MFEGLAELIASPQAWTALLTLTFMEVILGIDNIVFISIVANKLSKEEQPKARNIGLLLAMVLRVILLFGISIMLQYLTASWGDLHILSFHAQPNGQAIVLILGGIFLLYKTIKEIHHKLEGHNPENNDGTGAKLMDVIIQITIINMVFSVDSILTAIGLTQDLTQSDLNALPVMILGVIFSVLIMIAFAGPIGRYINKHPSIQMLALSFLLLISFMLIAEGGHLAHAAIGDFHIEAIPKGYLYFAIAFSTLVQMLVLRMDKKSEPVILHSALQEAEERNLLQ
ncbi:TerC family protein [Saprospira grandis]|uniref:Integral membrane protein terc n=1 Tax=Saprospira grandis (strain Lewin) TaxID=984262 RepID=H6L7Y7_SAPGL|nr:TerC family protein [Saprospira grandis]AFC24208.1 integral membrane protein terc [Saprospira grandis str. Lewin]